MTFRTVPDDDRARALDYLTSCVPRSMRFVWWPGRLLITPVTFSAEPEVLVALPPVPDLQRYEQDLACKLVKKHAFKVRQFAGVCVPPMFMYARDDEEIERFMREWAQLTSPTR